MLNLISASFFSSSKNDIGVNQDSVLPPLKINNGYLFAIADGVGGYPGGREASNEVIDYLRYNFQGEFNQGFNDLFPKIKNKVIELSSNDKELSNAASTLTFCFVKERKIYVGHIGDCRLYYKSGIKLVQITKDHTMHQHYIEQGIFTAKQLKNVKGKNLLTTAISKNFNMEFDIIEIPTDDVIDEFGCMTLFILSDGAHSFWEKRPRFSINTMSEPSRYISSLKKRIENGPPIDDYSAIAVKFCWVN
ncbi:TPA: PP2C family serine/threonine-protein phosphatase [Morganella morganii]|uniref:PP2C family protein-serine/threonine phosphatase n=1 Tax=Morganella morganii TaxID=582 RepID=UPI003862BC39